MTTLFLIYLLGCLLSFFRVYASFRELYRKIGYGEIGKEDWFAIWFVTTMSWCGFLTGIYFYIKENEKRFF